MRKRTLLVLGLVACQLFTVPVEAKSYSKNVKSGNYAYTFSAYTNRDCYKKTPILVHQYQKGDPAHSWTGNVSKSSTISSTASISSTISSTIGTDISVFGQSAKASLTAGVTSSLGITDRVP